MKGGPIFWVPRFTAAFAGGLPALGGGQVLLGALGGAAAGGGAGAEFAGAGGGGHHRPSSQAGVETSQRGGAMIFQRLLRVLFRMKSTSNE